MQHRSFLILDIGVRSINVKMNYQFGLMFTYGSYVLSQVYLLADLKNDLKNGWVEVYLLADLKN